MSRIRISSVAVVIALCAGIVPAQTAPEDPAAIAQRAMELQQSGQYAAAADAYRALLKLAPNEVAAHVNFGVVLVNLGRYDDAIAEYEAAGKLLPGDPRIALNLALAYEKSGRLQEAEKRFASLHSTIPQDDKVTMLLADCRLQMGEDDGVIELLQPLETRNPDDLGLAYMLGMALLHKQRIKEGQALLDRILRHGDTAEARFLLGTRMFESGDFPAAVKELASAIELNPNLPQLQSLYGRALLTTGDPDAAAKAFRTALSENPNDYASNLGLGQILLVRKEYKDAAALLQRALALRPQSAEASLALAGALSGLRQFGGARPHAEAAAAAMPGSAEAHRTLLSVYGGLHLTVEANREQKTLQALTSAAQAATPGPKLNERAPDFELAEAASSQKISLRSYRGKSPVVLVFGSYSCPNLRSAADALKSMHERYRARVPFLLVYIREAHTGNDWQSTRNQREAVNIGPAATMPEKEQHAAMCSRKLHFTFPAVVDGMDGKVEAAYGAWPSRAFVIGSDGRVMYSTRLTELDFHADEMDAVLRRLASRQRASGIE
jgi:tetratricopeptide (TPR) repeat protein